MKHKHLTFQFSFEKANIDNLEEHQNRLFEKHSSSKTPKLNLMMDPVLVTRKLLIGIGSKGRE